MYLFFDTETTGLPDYKLDLEDPGQPHILQLACLLTDQNGREMISWKAPIIPEGYTIDERMVGDNGKPTAFSVNKLTNDLVNTYGITLAQALRMFKSFEQRAELKIAHNYRFDGFLLKVAHARAGLEPLDPPIDRFCTMKAITGIMKLPPTDKMVEAGFQNSPKSAKLSEAYKYCTGKELENAHDALADVRACKDIFFWLLDNNLFEHQERYIPKDNAA